MVISHKTAFPTPGYPAGSGAFPYVNWTCVQLESHRQHQGKSKMCQISHLLPKPSTFGSRLKAPVRHAHIRTSLRFPTTLQSHTRTQKRSSHTTCHLFRRWEAFSQASVASHWRTAEPVFYKGSRRGDRQIGQTVTLPLHSGLRILTRHLGLHSGTEGVM